MTPSCQHREPSQHTSLQTLIGRTRPVSMPTDDWHFLVVVITVLSRRRQDRSDRTVRRSRKGSLQFDRSLWYLMNGVTVAAVGVALVVIRPGGRF